MALNKKKKRNRKDLFGNGRILNGGRFFFVKTAVRKRYERKLGEKEWKGRKEGRGVGLSVDKGTKARTDKSGRKTGGIIALIDQPDNSISICVIQMVFNFPQRYLHFSIYISFVWNCLPSTSPSSPSPGSLQGLDFLSLFLKSFKNCGLSYLHVVKFSSKLFPSRNIVKRADIKYIFNRIIRLTLGTLAFHWNI